MSWFTRGKTQSVQYMDVTHVAGVTYNDLKKIFGEPDWKSEYNSPNRKGGLKAAEWTIKLFGLRFKIKPDLDAFIAKQMKAGRKKWTTPDLDDPVIDHAEIVGRRKYAENFVAKMILAEAGKYKDLNSQDFQAIIKIVFEDKNGWTV